MPSCIVVGRILLSADQQLGVEKLAVITSADLIDRRGVKVDEDGTRDIFAAASLGEDGIELARVVERLRVGIRTTVLLQAMFEEVSCLLSATTTWGWSVKRLTTPKHCSRAGCQPGRYGDAGSRSLPPSSASNLHCDTDTEGGCTNAEVDSAAAICKHTSPLVILSSDNNFV